MADDNFSVSANFKTTADTSGVDKLQAAEKAAAASARQLADELDDAGRAATASQDGATNATERFRAGQDKAAASSRNMGNSMREAGRIIQDFSAAGFNGIANNMEGLAVAMGLGGGVAGIATVLAVAIQALGPAFIEWLTSAGEAGKKIEELKAPLEGYTSDADLAAARSRAFAESLQQEAKAAQAAAEAVKHEADMLRARNEVAAAASDNASAQKLRELEASDLPEPDKARKRAEIAAAKEQEDLKRREEERAKQGDVLRAEADAKERAARRMQAMSDEAAKRARDVGVRQGLTEQTIPAAQADLDKAASDAQAARNLPGAVPKDVRDKAIAEADQAAAEAKRRLDEATKARDAIAPGDAKEENDKARAAEEAAKKAREDAAAARAAANRGQARLSLEREADRTRTKGRVDDIMWKGDAAAAAASKAATEAKEREQTRQERERDKAAAEREKARKRAEQERTAGVMDTADKAAGTAADAGLPDAAKNIRDAVSGLKDGATQGEVQEAAAALRQLAEAMNQKNQQDAATRAQLSKLWAEVNTLAGQLKNTR